MDLELLKKDCARKQKKGLHFILASVIVWTLVSMVHLSELPILTKNLFTFCCTGILVPLAWMISKVLRIEFSDKVNPLSQLGLLFALNQMLYILIVMWVYAAVPEKMVMVLAMVFGAHLLPFSWLYQSPSYRVLSIVVPFLSLVLGCMYPIWVLTATMVVVEILFSCLLVAENKKLESKGR